MSITIIVEGKNDKSRLKRVVDDSVLILCTFGTPSSLTLEELRMKAGNNQKVRALVDDFFETISEYQYEEIIQYLSQMVMMSERIANVITDDD